MRTSEARRLPLGERIRWARQRKGLSLDKLAAAVGSSRQHLIRLEKGQHTPGVELRVRIAIATEQPSDFFEDEADDEEDSALARELHAVIRKMVERERRREDAKPAEVVS